MLAEGLKKILRIRACPERSPGSGRVFIERMQHRVLLFSRQGGELGSAREYLLHSRLQIGQSLSIRLLVVDRKRGQAMIDEIHNAGLVRPRSVVRRNDAGSDGVDLRRLFRAEKFKFWRRRGLRGIMRVLCGG